MPVSRKNTSSTLADEIYYQLFQKISSCRLLPGTKLSEVELSRQFNCSRIPVREAVQRLVAVDALEVHPQRGSFVTRINLSKMEEIRYIREVLESHIVLEAFDAGLLRSILPLLSSLTERQKAAMSFDDYEQVFSLDHEFHRIFYTITSKEFVLPYSGEENIHYRRARLITMKRELKTAMIEQHETIIREIEKEDRPALETALTHHFRNVNVVLQNDIFSTEPYKDYFL